MYQIFWNNQPQEKFSSRQEAITYSKKYVLDELDVLKIKEVK
jgi:hypothetical protein